MGFFGRASGASDFLWVFAIPALRLTRGAAAAILLAIDAIYFGENKGVLSEKGLWSVLREVIRREIFARARVITVVSQNSSTAASAQIILISSVLIIATR